MTSMDLNSTYKDRPTLLWIAIIIVAAVGIWYLVQGALVLGTDFSAGLDELTGEFAELAGNIVAVILLFLGIFTLILAFLLFSGSNGGKTVLVIILVVSILFSAMSVVFGAYTSILELVLAIVVLLVLYQPPVKAYFK